MGSPKKIFITGGAGFIGSHIVKRALRDGHEVHALIRPTSDTWRLCDVFQELRVYPLDLLDFYGLLGAVKKIKPDIVIHCAVSNVYSGASADELVLLQTNLIGGMNLMNATRAIDYECFINTGTSTEYGFKSEPMKESDICEPVIAHGIFKLAVTLYGQLLARAYNKPVVTLRLFSPYGPYDDMRRFIMVTASAALNGKPLNLTSPEIARDYIYIDDIIDLYFECMAARDIKGEVFNVATGKQSTLGDVVADVELAARLKLTKTFGQIAGASYDTDRWVADMTKTFGRFAWRPKTTLEEGLKKTLSWLKINRRSYP